MSVKVKATIEVEFDADETYAARESVIRIPDDLTNGIEHGAGGIAHVKKGSVQITVKDATIDGVPLAQLR